MLLFIFGDCCGVTEEGYFREIHMAGRMPYWLLLANPDSNMVPFV